MVNQMKNTRENYEIRANQIIVPCIASFTSVISNDPLHKQLIYQILLKMWHSEPCVRAIALVRSNVILISI